MRRPIARLVAACALAVAMLTLTGAAVAGGGHDKGGDHGSKQTQSSDSQGKKPDSHTDHWTNTSVGANPDVSKKYGNGKTAAQIAKSRGAPDDQPLKGPGNSQPHKTYDCKHKNNHSGGVDVHAIKSYSSTGCSTEQKPEGQKPEERKPEEQKPEDHKVTICHATGSATNPYVQITVDEHALKNGHTTAKGDIIPAPAGGCPTAAPSTPVVPMVSFCDMESATSGELESKPATEVISHELNGSPEEARDIVPAFSFNGVTYSQGWDTNGQAIFNNNCQAVVQQQAPVVTTTTTPVTTTVTTETTTTVVAATTATTTVPQVAPATTTASAAGGVLGAQTTLATPKHHRGGVLGTVANVAGSTLPFTGFPVWLAVLIAAMLILAGIAVRRRGLGARL